MHPFPSLLFLSLALCASALFFGGAGGGGGGCGCQSSCGRKKRSIDPPPFLNLAATERDALCNSPELRQIMVDSMKDTANESGRSISALLEQHGDRFVVVCAETPFSYFVRPDTEFCGVRNGTHFCQAFEL